MGNSLKCLREFPEDAMHDAGYQLERVQRGEMPDDFKSMPSIGKELRRSGYGTSRELIASSIPQD
jgi:phage-related protein